MESADWIRDLLFILWSRSWR